MTTTRRKFLCDATVGGIALAVTPVALAKQDPGAPSALPQPGSVAKRELEPPDELQLNGEVFQAPNDPALWPKFREALNRWRDTTKSLLKYDDTLYRRPEFAWSASNYCCYFLMLCDERFYDWRRGRYNLDAFIEEGQSSFGGFDSVVLWHAYPRIGVDDRNQFDFYRDQPGGLAGLREVVREFHLRGMRAYIDYNPWDVGTRREGKSDLEGIAEIVRELDVDGVFLDTMRNASELRSKLDAMRRGVILEGEDAVPLESIHDHHASWAQGFADSPVPGIIRQKWFERRHMQHQIRRRRRIHTGELHAAWMNGSGMMVWENVFGLWFPWSPRDRSLLQTMLPIQRRFTGLFTSESWTPLVATEQRGVYASLWEGNGLRLWTLVNRLWEPVMGPLLRVGARPGESCFDLVAGKEADTRFDGGSMLLCGEIAPRGIGCFVAGAAQDLGEGLAEFVRRQSSVHAGVDQNADPPHVETRLIPAKETQRPARLPKGMIEVPAANLALRMEMRKRECGFYDSTPPPGTDEDPYHVFIVPAVTTFRRQVALKRFAVDETPVTNQEYAQFLKATGYEPEHAANFLKHWVGGGPPKGREDHPVVFVDLDDARAFARWLGKRLPTEEEWQYAAQGTDGRRYPWGEQMEAGRCNDGASGGTTPVRAFPNGRSPFGCYDMCGNVWHWTESVRTDNRTRFCIIRGGSWYNATGSIWYVEGGPRPASWAGKFLMAWPGLDRCSTIGFRCVVDL